MKTKIEKLLLNVNKPSRYIGNEVGCCNKNWDKSSLKALIAFPDLYEIGSSNLGHRILYHLINKEEAFLADRAYAPEVDFKDELKKNNLPLYGVEHFKPINEYDVIAFSLQYELSYPTILSMLEMGNIPVKSIDRNDSSPIIIAGGPGAYNPEPISDYIDVFIIGDGEEVIIEILNIINELKGNNVKRALILEALAEVKGVYIPSFYKQVSEFEKPVALDEKYNKVITKRITPINNENYFSNFPVPYSPSVHDRAVVEIRRGCGRMCRFCQSCYVNLPIREREPEKVLNITDKLLKNTGYEEYSLLSLSSSDYLNVEQLVKELNNRHSCKYSSISLPSQRADAFSLELAEEVQSVRKSTLTFAVEAGSQRLRDVINKNLTEEEVKEAIFSAYKAGWGKIKLYFMIGLPTETYEDLDEIVEILKRIKWKSKQIRQEFNLNKSLEINCTVSIFVPKPFTPFQWCAQDSLNVIDEKVKYLKGKIRSVKGVRLNFHDTFLSQLEAVFARGGRNLNKLIEAVWKNGSYLDAWNEHFNKDVWYKSAEEVNINFEEYACREFLTDSTLPWDFIDTGVNKSWLISEYNKAFASENSNVCDEKCVNCGVCSNLSVKKEINSDSDFEKVKPAEPVNTVDEEIYKYRLVMQKANELKYISHLDWLALIYKAFRKAGIKLNYTQGFNPSPKIAVGLALPLFIESNCEVVDVETKIKYDIEALKELLNKYLTNNSKILQIVTIPKGTKAIDQTACWAKYEAFLIDTNAIKEIELTQKVNDILSQPSILIEKKSKRQLKQIDIRKSIYSVDINHENDSIKLEFILKLGQEKTNLDIPTLRADNFIDVLTPNIKWSIKRVNLLDKDLKELV